MLLKRFPDTIRGVFYGLVISTVIAYTIYYKSLKENEGASFSTSSNIGEKQPVVNAGYKKADPNSLKSPVVSRSIPKRKTRLSFSRHDMEEIIRFFDAYNHFSDFFGDRFLDNYSQDTQSVSISYDDMRICINDLMKMDKARSSLKRHLDSVDSVVREDLMLEEAKRIGEGRERDYIKDRGGDSILHTACEYGHKEILQMLIKKGIDVNAIDKRGDTPLHCAARNGQVEIVALLLEKNANINARSKTGHSPISQAIRNGHLSIVKILSKNGAYTDNVLSSGRWTALHVASYYGQIDVLKYLIGHGMEVDAKEIHGATPLYLACQEGHIDTVKYLLSNGADRYITVEGNTLLHAALEKYNRRVTEYLISRGLDINAKNNNDMTPIDMVKAKNKYPLPERFDWLKKYDTSY